MYILYDYIHTLKIINVKNMHFRFQFRSGQDQIMEMTNDWYQLYAQGAITRNTNGMIHAHVFIHLFIYYEK